MQAPSYAYAAARIFDLSLGRMLWSRGTVFMGLVAGLPVLIGVLTLLLELSGVRMNARGVAAAGPMMFGFMIWTVYLRFVVPILALYYGTSLIADEVEDKTITYLFTRPIPRGAVMVGKYLAYLICTTMVILPSVILVYFLIVPRGGGHIGAEFPSLVVDLGLLFAGLAAYGALFAWVGARFKRPLIMGLVFIFGWEPVSMLLPGYLKRWTVSYYLQSLVPHSVPATGDIQDLLQTVFHEVAPTWVALLVLAAVTGGFLWLATRVVARREYVLEQ